jgi:MFS family permease
MPPRPLLAVSVAVAATLLGDSFLYAVLPTAWPQLGLELWMVGVLLSANRFVRFVTNPVAGWVYSRMGVRVPFIAAVLVAAATTATYGLAAGFFLLVLARALWGLCWSFLRLGGYLTALGSSDHRRRGYYLGLYTSTSRCGTLLAMLFGGLLADTIGFRFTALFFAAITLGAGLVLLRERFSPRPAGDQMAEKPRAAPVTVTPPLPDESEASRQRRGAVYAAAFINGLAGNSLAVATLGLWLVGQYGTTIPIGPFTLGAASVTGVLLAFNSLADVLWSPVAGHSSDRYGRVRFMLAAGAAAAVAMVGLSIPAGLPCTVAAACGVFASGTALRAALDAAAGDLASPAARSRVMSWYANWSDLGTATGPLLAYQLAPHIGLDWVYRGGAACLAATGLAVLQLLRDAQTRPEVGPGN